MVLRLQMIPYINDKSGIILVKVTTVNVYDRKPVSEMVDEL
ncbi:hypothetical protein BTN49_0604 [Candidatus Enterovibrio escicola]|uniref:Mobile element protein n=1 Tax=Candidatus Enterovibrio escicola TaxID=1927127 RepID=A0A2A5T640_9GAMM|nr:transposase [Candidatus Enterovibrio escacola]PCS23635.1 hypothetical protein BTN49_0604 [Candidatus Enterovibrio escacola]